MKLIESSVRMADIVRIPWKKSREEGALPMLRSSEMKRSVLALIGSLVLALVTSTTGFASTSAFREPNAVPKDVGLAVQSGIEGSSAQALSVNDEKRVTLTSFVETSSKAINAENLTLVRPNQEYRVQLHALRGSDAAAGVNITLELSGVALAPNSKMISIDGGGSLSGYPRNLIVVTDEDGVAKVSLRTIGFEQDDTLVLNASVEGASSAPLVMVTTTPAYSLLSENYLYATKPGESTKISFRVQDHWGVALSESGYRVRLIQEIDGFTFEKSAGEAPLVSGTAGLTLTTLPSALNRSAILRGVLERLDFSKNAWVSTGLISEPIRINVSEEPVYFKELPGASATTKVSYLPNKIEWVAITGAVSVPGSEVSVDGGEGLIFRIGQNSQAVAGGLSLRATADGKYSFEVASLRSGLHTISQRAGAVEVHSVLSVAAAPGHAGKSITFDKTSLPSGQTSKLTGTLLDENGNAVQTSGKADILVSWNGAGFSVGVGSVETDATGKFSIVILVPAAERGSGTITAIYRPIGQSEHPDNIYESLTLTIEKRPAEVSASLSSSNGQWIVLVENGIGLNVTVKAGSRWLKSIASSNSFNLSGRAQAGTTLPIKVWVDGELLNEQRLTIK